MLASIDGETDRDEAGEPVDDDGSIFTTRDGAGSKECQPCCVSTY